MKSILSLILISGLFSSIGHAAEIYKTCDLADRVNREDTLDLDKSQITIKNNGTQTFAGKMQSVVLHAEKLGGIQQILDGNKTGLKATSASLAQFNEMGAYIFVRTDKSKDIVIDVNAESIVAQGPDCATVIKEMAAAKSAAK